MSPFLPLEAAEHGTGNLQASHSRMHEALNYACSLTSLSTAGFVLGCTAPRAERMSAKQQRLSLQRFGIPTYDCLLGTCPRAISASVGGCCAPMDG